MTDTIISDNTTGLYAGDYSGTEDTALYSNTPTANYGSNGSLELTHWAGPVDKHWCLSFPGLSNISASEVVSTVTLGLYRSSGDSNTHLLGFKRLLRNWVEAGATYNIWSIGNNWTLAGGVSDGNDRSGTSSGTISSTSAAGFKTITDTGQLKSDIQDFIDGTLSNYGHHIDVLDTSNFWAIYETSEGVNGQRPYIVVTHAAGGTTSLLPARPRFPVPLLMM